MTAYASLTDVTARTRLPLGVPTLDETTEPKGSEVTRWLEEASARVDAALTIGGYPTIPATGTNDIILLRGWVANWGALMVGLYKAEYFGDVLPEAVRKQWDGFDQFLIDLANPSTKKAVLVDQSPSGGKIIAQTATRNDAYHQAAQDSGL